MSGFYEIRGVIETLYMIEVLMEENYPESIENKKQNSYITKIFRKYKKSYNKDILPQGNNNIIFKVIHEFLSTSVELRNKNIHSNKYIPDEINKIIGFEVASHKEVKFKLYAVKMRDDEKEKWIKKIKSNKKKIKKLLDAYFDYIYTIVCVEGKFRYPSEISKSKE